MKVKSESEVAQSSPTLCDPMDCSPPGSSIHGIFQARVLEWGATAFSMKQCYRQAKLKEFSTTKWASQKNVKRIFFLSTKEKATTKKYEDCEGIILFVKGNIQER